MVLSAPAVLLASGVYKLQIYLVLVGMGSRQLLVKPKSLHDEQCMRRPTASYLS
jgi:hypothetical protein